MGIEILLEVFLYILNQSTEQNIEKNHVGEDKKRNKEKIMKRVLSVLGVGAFALVFMSSTCSTQEGTAAAATTSNVSLSHLKRTCLSAFVTKRDELLINWLNRLCRISPRRPHIRQLVEIAHRAHLWYKIVWQCPLDTAALLD